jgi:Ca2+-binding RTX toxin-like protein
MAITASFNAGTGVLSINGDNADNTVVVSRDMAGAILVNGGAVVIQNGAPTVATTILIEAAGLNGKDSFLVDQANGALPATSLLGGNGNDTATGGDGNDQLRGQANADVLIGGGGADSLFGGDGNDTLTGGNDNDRVFGQGGNDVMVWNPGDDSDLFEGGTGTDTAQINAGNGGEALTITANGTRVRFDRVDPAPFSLDIGTTERLVLDASGGDDIVRTKGNLSALIKLTIDGGVGNDTLFGSNGSDRLLGGDGNDFVDGQQGNDVALLGAGDDTFRWNPGDGNDVVEGAAGKDTLQFNGNNAANKIDVTGSGTTVVVAGLSAKVTVKNSEGANDTVLVNGLGGSDTLSAASLVAGITKVMLDGGTGNDTVRGSQGGDALFGGIGNDVLDGLGGFDFLFGGDGNDTLTGGDGDDQVIGEGGNDVMIWNPGHDTDLFEGGSGTDTARVNGGNGAEVFTVTANGTRVRFDRLDPAPFSLDIGTTERLVLKANGGDDLVTTSGNLATLIQLTIDGGDGNDILLGSNGADTFLGGTGDDFVDGQQGNDVAFLGAGDDTFNWDPGDGNDIVEGEAGSDTLQFNCSAASETLTVSANGGRVLLNRDIANIVMDLDDIETIRVRALGGIDNLTVNNLAGTDAKRIFFDLAATIGGSTGDAAADTITVNGSAGANKIDVTGSGTSASVTGLPARVIITNSEGANDALIVNGRNGNDTITATDLLAGVTKLTLDGWAGNDTIRGSQGADILLGGAGNDSVLGDNGNDIALLGAGNDIFRWVAGDGSDVIEGQDGTDSLVLTGSGASETIDISANGMRGILFRNVASVTLDFDDVEVVKFNALLGADTILVNDLTGTDIDKVDVNLAGVSGGVTGDGQVDSVTVNATNVSDHITIVSAGGGIVIEGLAAETTVRHADLKDKLVIEGLGGDDVIDARGLAAGKISLQLNGGLGGDLIFGSAGRDTVNGGDGLDRVRLGAGNDTFVWNPGDDNDTVEGQAGTDRLIFTGVNLAENINVLANGARTLFTRDVAAVVMDLNDVEVIQFNALGGVDNINVGNLTGTDVKRVLLDLGLGGTTTDGQLDTVTVNGSAAGNAVTISSLGSKVVVDGLTAQVAMDHADAGDTLVVRGRSGNDVIDAGDLSAGKMVLQLFGDSGNDTITGSAGADSIIGGSGNDLLRGGSGDDTISGGAGNDRIVGGPGNDTIQYSSALDGHDVIDGFDGNATGGQDVIDLDLLFDNLGVVAGREARVSINDKGGFVNIAIDADGDAGNGFELKIATLNTTDDITVGQDVLVGS